MKLITSKSLNNYKKILSDLTVGTEFTISSSEINLGSGAFSLDPIEKVIEATEPIEEEKKKEAGAVLRGIRENEKKFREDLDLETNTNFYFSVICRSEKEYKEFIAKYKIPLQFGDYCFKEDLEPKMKTPE